MRNNRQEINRIFRADTQHDVFCAAIIAKNIPPGNNFLLINNDYGNGSAEFLECMYIASSAYNWEAVIDISGYDVNQEDSISIRDKINRIYKTKNFIRYLRQKLIPYFNVSPQNIEEELNRAVDEVYLNCFHHPEVQFLFRIFPAAKKIYYPHGFDSLHKGEFSFYEKYFYPQRLSVANSCADFFKRVFFGKDAEPIRRLNLDAVYSFNEFFPDIDEQYQLKTLLNKENMSELFNNLDEKVKNYYAGLVDKCSESIGLLLLYVEIKNPHYPKELELLGYSKLIEELVSREKTDTLLIKPHPLISQNWFYRIKSYLNESFPSLNLVFLEEYHYLAVEIVMSYFQIKACAGIASGSLRTLQRIYNLPVYYSGNLLRRLHRDNPIHKRGSQYWLDDVKGLFNEVEI